MKPIALSGCVICTHTTHNAHPSHIHRNSLPHSGRLFSCVYPPSCASYCPMCTNLPHPQKQPLHAVYNMHVTSTSNGRADASGTRCAQSATSAIQHPYASHNQPLSYLRGNHTYLKIWNGRLAWTTTTHTRDALQEPAQPTRSASLPW